MKRSELTVDKMKDMGWEPEKKYSIKDIVSNIKTKNTDGRWIWDLRVTDDGTYSKTEYGMCSTYDVKYKTECLEASEDGKKWFKVAERDIVINRKCTYAD